MKNTGLRHAMVNSDALAGEYCEILNLGEIFGPLVQCGPRAQTLAVDDSTTLRVTFSECVSISGTTGIEYSINGGAWAEVAGTAKVSDTVWTFTIGTPLSDGDTVSWRYVADSGSIVDCVDAEDIGQQGPLSYTLPAGVSLVFHALDKDGADVMQGVLVGTGGLTEARAADLWDYDYQNIYQQYGAEPAWQRGRVTGAVGSRVTYGDGPELPYLVYAPEMISISRYSQIDVDGNAWRVGVANPVYSFDQIGIDGQVSACRQEDNETTATSELALRLSAPSFSAGERTTQRVFWKPASANTNFIRMMLNAVPHWNTVIERQTGIHQQNGNFANAYTDTHNSWFVSTMESNDHTGNTSNRDLFTAGAFNTDGSSTKSDVAQGILDIAHYELYKNTPADVARYAPAIFSNASDAEIRDGCAQSFDLSNWRSDVQSGYIEQNLIGAGNLIGAAIKFTGAAIELTDGVNTASLAAAAGERKIGWWFDTTAGQMRLCVDGVWSAVTTFAGPLNLTSFDLFRDSQFPGGSRQLKLWDGVSEDKINAEMAA